MLKRTKSTKMMKLAKESGKFNCEKNLKILVAILVLAGVVVLVMLGQKVGCASGDDAGDAEVVAPCVAVLHAESASSCGMHAVGVDGSQR